MDGVFQQRVFPKSQEFLVELGPIAPAEEGRSKK